MNIIENSVDVVRRSIGWVLQNPITATTAVSVVAFAILKNYHSYCGGTANALVSEGSMLQRTISEECNKSFLAYPFCKSFQEYIEATPEGRSSMRMWCENALPEAFEKYKETACANTKQYEPLHYCGPIVLPYP